MRNLDIALCINIMHPPGLYSGSVSSNTQEEYDSILWEDQVNAKPTWQQLNTFWNNNQNLFDVFYEGTP